jgi:hypothetical protein
MLIGEKSIFEAYKYAFDTFKTGPNDVFILCHDDIEVLSSHSLFNRIIGKSAFEPNRGFTGVAGTTKLTPPSVWWNQEIWKAGGHRGYVFHGSKEQMQSTWYGAPGQVLVMDGLFLAARAEVLEKVNLAKPKEFTGDWDFYDLHYTMTAHKMGFKNYVEPIMIRHESFGNLAGRQSWHDNRLIFSGKHFPSNQDLMIAQ